MVKAIRDGFIRWGIPTLMAAMPLAVWFNQVRETLRRLGWQTVSLSMSVLVFVLVWFLMELIKSKKKEEGLRNELEAERNKDITANLEPIPGTGFQKDKRNGQVVCQKCLVEHRMISYMKYNSGGGIAYYHCNGCGWDFDA